MTLTSATSGPRTLGVVGTLVWDSILSAEHSKPVEEWGGIAYSLAAMDVALSEDWTVLPIVKVGRDLEVQAQDFVGQLERVQTSVMVRVAEPNNRVELRYHDAHERTETLSGGVPEWTADELIALADHCDALYLNFISGFEMTLETATELRRAFSGPMYVDLHSLFLGIDETGRRVPCRLAHADQWFALGDFVQLNRAEATLLADSGFAMDTPGPAGLAITDGPAGVRYEVAASLLRSPPEWPDRTQPTERAVRGRISPDDRARVVDPTGCGDVWGGACFAGLVDGLGARHAAERGTRMAEAALAVRGAGNVHGTLASLPKIREGGS